MYLLLDFDPLVTAPPELQHSRVKNKSTLGKLFFLGELYIRKEVNSTELSLLHAHEFTASTN